MKEEEFKRKISWKIEEGDHEITLKGGFILSVILRVPANNTIALDLAKKEIEEKILRWFYEDRRKEFYEKINELFRLNPHEALSWNSPALFKWREEFLKIAKRQ